MNGHLEPGEVLDEQRLQDRFGVPVPVLRDAITALVAEGLLVSADYGSVHVMDPNPETVGDTLKTIGVLMGGVVRQTIPTLSTPLSQQLAGAVDRVQAVAE